MTKTFSCFVCLEKNGLADKPDAILMLEEIDDRIQKDSYIRRYTNENSYVRKEFLGRGR